jgi:GMP synthase (glutamine-hydrolysing)
MRSIQVLQHVPMEGPARVAGIARSLGLGVTVHNLFESGAAPVSVPADDVLVVMGGSMGVGDLGDPRYPYLASEVELIARQVRAGAPVLGICLGSQLMAHALGARVAPLLVGTPPVRHREVGWGALQFMAPAGEPCLAGIPDAEVVLHWHGDTFELPPGATLLASTLACKNQMFRVGRRAFGLQFHIEVDEPDVVTWTREDAEFVLSANGPTGSARILEETARFMPRYREFGDRMLRNIFAAMLEPRP